MELVTVSPRYVVRGRFAIVVVPNLSGDVSPRVTVLEGFRLILFALHHEWMRARAYWRESRLVVVMAISSA